MPKSKLFRWLVALAIVLAGSVGSFNAAAWLQSLLGLPSLPFKWRHGTPADVVVLALGIGLFMDYLYVVPKLLRITHDELSQMLRGE